MTILLGYFSWVNHRYIQLPAPALSAIGDTIGPKEYIPWNTDSQQEIQVGRRNPIKPTRFPKGASRHSYKHVPM